jgi:signal peptidase
MRPSPSAPRRELRAGAAALRAVGWALALLGALSLALTAYGIAVGATPLVVKSGSMRPRLPVGTVVIVRPAAARSVRVGEVVAVRRVDGRRILHRVRSLRAAGGGAVTLVVKGDRNRAADPPLTVTRVERPLVTVPWLASPIGWLDGPWTQFWLGVLTGAAALGWLLGPRRASGPPATARELP